MKKLSLIVVCSLYLLTNAKSQSFTAGNIVVLQTAGTASKASSQVTLKEFSTTGSAGLSVTVPSTGPTPFQSGGVYGGSEGFLSTSTDGRFLVLGGYKTAATFSDITGTTAASVPRVIGIVYPSGYYLEIDTSGTYYSANDIRGGISDGTNFWASGAANNNVDGINYWGPGPKAALASGGTPAKAYGLRIFNGQIYYSTQKSGPNNTASQLGIFALGSGLPTSGTVVPTQIINTGSVAIPQDFSIDPTGTICYIAINLNTVNGGIQKWTKTGSVWSLAYTLGTGITNTGAYGLVVDYSGTSPVIYATTFDAAGNRVIKITDIGSTSTATTLVAATAGTYYKGISFAPVATGLPVMNLSVSTDTASEAGATAVTVSANTSAPVTGNQTVTVAVSGTGISTGDYTLSNTTITIPNGATTGSVTFTVVNDILGEGPETAILTSSNFSAGIAAGPKTVQRIAIADNDGNNHPTISMNIDSTTNYIDGGVTTAPLSPFKLSGVLNDPTDPAATLGLYFKVSDLETIATNLTVTLKSSNTTVVPTVNLNLTGTDSIKKLIITPAAVGYSNITVIVKDGLDSTSYIINYAASAASSTPANTIWHTGISDGSDAVALDNSYYICGDDELNLLNVYSRTASGLPLTGYNYTSFLNLPEPNSPEVDIEAATKSLVNNGKVFWLGSMSNGKSPFNSKPNRDRIFATNVTGTGAATSFSFSGYAALKSTLLSWGDANGYNFTSSAAAGVDSKSPSGFAAEGMVFGPDSTTLYIGLRAPLVPVTNRNKAVIAPIQNFEAWFNNGNPVGNPVFGNPIELNLGGRGIRDIVRLSNGIYVIVAGSSDGNVSGAIYKWTGKATDEPIAISSPSTNNLNMEGALPIGTTSSFNSLQVISDHGDEILYNDGSAAKDFNDLIYRKYRLDNVNAIDLTMPPLFTNVQTDTSANTAPNSCDTIISYIVNTSAVPQPTLTYTFTGATSGSGTGTGSGSVFNRGITQVTISANNQFGTTDTSFTITVIDNITPAITAPAAVTVTSDPGVCFASNVTLGAAVSTDNCTTTTSNDAPQTFNAGTTTVIWTVTDAEGNSDTAHQFVTVEAVAESWTGVADTLWSNPANWSCNQIPTFVTDVTVPATAPNMPVINIAAARAHSVTINTGAQLHFTGTANVLEVKGDIVSNGSFNASSGGVTLSGANSQQLAGAVYGRLDIDSGSTKMLSGNVTVSGTLQLNNGYVLLGQYDLRLADPSLVSGASPLSFIVTDSTGVVTGQNIGNGTGSITFPVGHSSNDYTPLLFSNSGTADDFSVRVRDGIFEHYSGDNPNGPQQIENAVDKTWFITEAVIGGSNATVTPQWKTANELPLFNRSASCVSHYNTTTNLWQPGLIAPATGSDPYSRSMTVTSFSPFGVGSASSPLDLKLLTFTAAYQTPLSILDWTTAPETGLRAFSIERSADGVSFTNIGSVQAGDKNGNKYQFTDNAAKAQNASRLYYRLLLDKENGEHSYSSIVNITITPDIDGDITLTPNPVMGGELSLNIPGTATADIEILNMEGKQMAAYHFQADGNTAAGLKLNVEGLAGGTYILHIIHGNGIHKNIKFTKQ